MNLLGREKKEKLQRRNKEEEGHGELSTKNTRKGQGTERRGVRRGGDSQNVRQVFRFRYTKIYNKIYKKEVRNLKTE